MADTGSVLAYQIVIKELRAIVNGARFRKGKSNDICDKLSDVVQY